MNFSAIVVYDIFNSIGRPLASCLMFCAKWLWKLIVVLWITIFFIPMTMINFTFYYKPKNFKEFLNPFSYGIIGEIFECCSWENATDDDNDFAGVAMLFGIVFGTIFGVFLFVAFPLAYTIRLYMQGSKEKSNLNRISKK